MEYGNRHGAVNKMSLQTNRMTADIRFKIYPDEMREFDLICDASNRTKSDILRSWFRRFLVEHKKDKYWSGTSEDRYKDPSRVS